MSDKKSWHEILAVLTPLILGVCVTGVGSAYTYINNTRQIQISQISALEKFRDLLLSENDADREFAYASFVALGYESLALKIIQTKRDPAGRNIAETIKETGSAGERSIATATLDAIPPRVYIQVASDSQKKSAEEFSKKLTAMGYSVKGIENVLGKADLPQKTNVRYFNPEDEAIAKSIVETLHQGGVTEATKYKVSRYKVRPGSIEVWFSLDPK